MLELIELVCRTGRKGIPKQMKRLTNYFPYMHIHNAGHLSPLLFKEQFQKHKWFPVSLSSVEGSGHDLSERGCCQHQALNTKKILSNTQTNNIQNSMKYKWIRLDYKLGTREKDGEITKVGRKEILRTKTNLRFCAI